MRCDVGEVTERLENEQSSERMSCDVGDVTKRLENEERQSLEISCDKEGN